MDKTRLDPTRGPISRPPQAAPGLATPTHSFPGSTDPLQDLRSLGDFHILRRLGEGGMGAVYLAYHGREDKQVALKVLNDQLVSNQGYVDRFYREAKSGALLNHPNIVRTLSVGQDRASGKHYLVLEYVDGPSAHALMDLQGPLSVGDAVHIALDVARALEHAHSRNIVHRDIKPDNILLTRSGVAKLGDLGLAKRTDEPSHLTATRQGFGTTAYMPYEQAINAKFADGRSDIYALGATLYHLVTGTVPFPGDNHLEVIDKKNLGLFTLASDLNPDVPAALDQILAHMLARQPRDRYQTASELIIDLERSRLAAQLPSFADPEQARRDPWVQACMSSSEPTRLDPQAPPTPSPAKETSGETVWRVRYTGRDGRWRIARATTSQIRERLEAGSLPRNTEVIPREGDQFRPVAEVKSFSDLIPHPEPVEEPGIIPSGWSGKQVVSVAAGLGLTLVTVILGLLHLLGRI